MNKELFMKLLNRWFVEMVIEPKDCHVSHGGAMLMHGLRESTQDIDLTVNKRVWDKFVELGFEVKVLPDCGLVKGISLISVTENIDIHLSDVDYSGKLLLENNIYFRDLNTTLNDKILLGRKKDEKDIILLKSLLGQVLEGFAPLFFFILK